MPATGAASRQDRYDPGRALMGRLCASSAAGGTGRRRRDPQGGAPETGGQAQGSYPQEASRITRGRSRQGGVPPACGQMASKGFAGSPARRPVTDAGSAERPIAAGSPSIFADWRQRIRNTPRKALVAAVPSAACAAGPCEAHRKARVLDARICSRPAIRLAVRAAPGIRTARFPRVGYASG